MQHCQTVQRQKTIHARPSVSQIHFLIRSFLKKYLSILQPSFGSDKNYTGIKNANIIQVLGQLLQAETQATTTA